MKQLQVIQAGLKAPKNNRNTFGNYKYRKAEDILTAVKPLLGCCTVNISDEVIYIPCEEDRIVKVKTQQPNPANGRMMEVTEDRVIHTGGRFFMKATASISDGAETATSTGCVEIDRHSGMSTEQCCGAASSYARKIALCGLFGISDDENDPDAIDNRPRTQQQPQQHQFASPLAEVQACNTLADLARLWNTNPEWQQNRQIAAAFTARRQQIEGRRNG